MRRWTIRFYKVQWSHHSEKEATWGTKDFRCSKYPEFLPHSDACVPSFVIPFCDHNLVMRFPLAGGGCNTPRLKSCNLVLIMNITMILNQV
jgi:hypothetical protein